MIVTDGSFLEKHQTGAAAWVLCTSDGIHRIEGTIIAPGLPFQQNAYQSELTGVMAAFDYLQYYLKRNNITTGQIKLCCDNKSVLEVISSWQVMRTNPRQKNSDLVGTCLKLRDSIPITILTEHVYGHQDTHNPMSKLTTISKLNVQMDKKAKDLALSVALHPTLRTDYLSHPLSFPPLFLRQTTNLTGYKERIIQTHGNHYSTTVLDSKAKSTRGRCTVD